MIPIDYKIVFNLYSSIAVFLLLCCTLYNINARTAVICCIYSLTAPTGPPRDITLMDIDPTMLSLRYRPPETSLRNGDVTGYVIRYTRVGSGVSQMIIVNGGSAGLCTSDIPGLVAFTNYSVEVAAVNVNGTGPFSDPVTGLSGQDSKKTFRSINCSIHFLYRTCCCSTFTNSRKYPVKICKIVMDVT